MTRYQPSYKRTPKADDKHTQTDIHTLCMSVFSFLFIYFKKINRGIDKLPIFSYGCLTCSFKTAKRSTFPDIVLHGSDSRFGELIGTLSSHKKRCLPLNVAPVRSFKRAIYPLYGVLYPIFLSLRSQRRSRLRVAVGRWIYHRWLIGHTSCFNK